MELNDIKNKERVAIVAVGYNRLGAMKRLLTSLQNAHYSSSDIPLYISVDASGDLPLYDYVRSFEWSNGDKYINIQEERLGLRKHILQCGDLTKYFKAIILLEDDIFVSEYYYEYVLRAIDFYGNEDRIGGISLINSEMGYPGLPQVYMIDGSDAFLRQSPASWGECWTKKQWDSFRQWYDHFTDDEFSAIDIPLRVKGWKQAWSKYFMAYLVSTGRYFLYPHISHTTCFGDAGVHASSISSVSQTNLLAGPKVYHFNPFEKMVRYDAFGINEEIYEWAGISREELCVDWYCQNPNIGKRRYILTTAILPYKIEKTYGLHMRPIELNVKYGIEGEGIYLYDTKGKKASAYGSKIPISVAFYHLRSFNMRLAAHYAIHHYWHAIKSKLLFFK